MPPFLSAAFSFALSRKRFVVQDEGQYLRTPSPTPMRLERVSGGRFQVSGVRGQVAGGRCQVAGGSTTGIPACSGCLVSNRQGCLFNFSLPLVPPRGGLCPRSDSDVTSPGTNGLQAVWGSLLAGCQDACAHWLKPVGTFAFGLHCRCALVIGIGLCLRLSPFENCADRAHQLVQGIGFFDESGQVQGGEIARGFLLAVAAGQ